VDVVLLSRLQFAFTVAFHFIFPAITIGLAGLIAITETLRWRTNRDVYDRLAVFLTKLFAVTFVIGVVSGVVMEFQFGTNWSRFSGLVGDIFGAPLAAEGIFAFFLESAFVGLILFGRKRISSTVRWLAAVAVCLGTLMSAFWIIVANSWMHTPAGYATFVDSSGILQKVELTSFWAAVFNPSTLPRFFHTVASCGVVGAFLVMGIGAFYVLRRRHLDVAGVALRMGIVVAFVGSVLMFVTGDLQTREVAVYQPVKFAAMEGVFETVRGVELTIISLPPSETDQHPIGIGIPKGLSLLMSGDANGEIAGLKNLTADPAHPDGDSSLWPPVAPTFMSFHVMVGLGALMLLLMVFGAFYMLRRTLETHRTWLRLAVLAIPLPIIAVELGWMTAEVGRQPWLIQGLLKTNDGVSPGVSAADVWISLIGVFLLYSLLFVLWLRTMVKEVVRGPEPAPMLGASVIQAVSDAAAAVAATMAKISSAQAPAPAARTSRARRAAPPPPASAPSGKTRGPKSKGGN
jgi:cytochrome d ubiquinol oxidase subunit I